MKRRIVPGGGFRPHQEFHGARSGNQHSRHVSQRHPGSQILGKHSQVLGSMSAQTAQQQTVWSLAWGAKDPFPRAGVGCGVEVSQRENTGLRREDPAL